jgi:hypothetical protein
MKDLDSKELLELYKIIKDFLKNLESQKEELDQ